MAQSTKWLTLAVRGPLRATATFAYVRFHGSGSRYGGNYSDQALEDWAERLGNLASGLDEVWIYFNNDLGGHAPRNAMTLRELLGQPAPATPTRS